MLKPTRPQRAPSRREGHILIMLSFLLVVLIGMLGLVNDGGILMTSQRQAQNAADAAARACAKRVQYEEGAGNSISGAMLSVLQPVADGYGLTKNTNWNDSSAPTGAVIEVHHPPSTGPYATNLSGTNGHVANRYVEVIVSYPVTTSFIQVLGVSSSRVVRARAVAGYDSVAAGAGLVILDPNGSPGLGVSGTNAVVDVRNADTGEKFDIYVFSKHNGVDEHGDTVGTNNSGQPAAKIGGGATVTGGTLYVSGGVDAVANFDPPDIDHLDAGTLAPVFDPFFNEGSPLPVPTTANGVDATIRGNVSVSNSGLSESIDTSNTYDSGTGVTTLYPGVYSDLSISNGAIVELQPGIYVLRPPANGGGNILTINGGTVRLPVGATNGVMFYNTGSGYDPATGGTDGTDLTLATDVVPTSPDNFRGISITGSNVSLGGYTSSGGAPFSSMLIYQRRANRENITVNNGLPAPSGFKGTFYAKWANLALAGGGTYNFAIVVGTLSTNGNAVINVPSAIPFAPRVQPIYLVE